MDDSSHSPLVLRCQENCISSTLAPRNHLGNELSAYDPTSFRSTDQTASEFHYQSQQIFIRIPEMVPYDAPIVVSVQNGDIDEMRRLLISKIVSIDTVDPFGLGLFYVREFTPLSWKVANSFFTFSMQLIIVGEAPGLPLPLELAER
jgi:hypothetical protein